MSTAAEELWPEAPRLFSGRIFSRPNLPPLEPFQVLARAHVLGSVRTHLFSPLWIEQTVVAMETVTRSRAAFPAPSCWRTLAWHPIKGVVQRFFQSAAKNPTAPPSRLTRAAAHFLCAEQSDQKSEAKTSSKLFGVSR